MFAQERQQRLLDLLDRRRRFTLAELQAKLGASPATVRRDLDFLEREGKVVRTHGGVVHPDEAQGEISFDRKARAATEAKQSIAAAAAALVPPESVVFVDAGTSTLAAGRLLLERPDLTVFTNSLPLLAARKGLAGARLVALGGELRGVSLALVGGGAVGWLGRLRFDFALLGASGLHPADGASTTELSEAEVKTAALARARRVLLLADSSKWARPAAIGFATWPRIQVLVTDRAPAAEARDALARAGVETRLAR